MIFGEQKVKTKLYIIRKRISLDEKTALFILINNTLVPSNMSLHTAYNNYSNNNGYFLGRRIFRS